MKNTVSFFRICFLVLIYSGCNTSQGDNKVNNNALDSNRISQEDFKNHQETVEENVYMSLFGRLEIDLNKNPGTATYLLNNYLKAIKSNKGDVIFNHLNELDFLSTGKRKVMILEYGGTSIATYLCSFSDSFKVIDTRYLGTTTMFDNGHSENISYKLNPDKQVLVNETHYGAKNNHDSIAWEIDTIYFCSYSLLVNENGMIEKSGTNHCR